MKIQVGNFETEIDEETTQQIIFEVDFGNSLRVKIERAHDGFKIINAMDGWGDNAMEIYHNAPITIYP